MEITEFLKSFNELAAMFGGGAQTSTLKSMIGKKVIVRTYTAGVFFGTLAKKEGAEVILEDARRMWRWCANKSISLSGCALYGINDERSKIAPPVCEIWLEAIEIIPCTRDAVTSIEGAKYAEAE